MIPKSGTRFSEKIMLQQKARAIPGKLRSGFRPELRKNKYLERLDDSVKR